MPARARWSILAGFALIMFVVVVGYRPDGGDLIAIVAAGVAGGLIYAFRLGRPR